MLHIAYNSSHERNRRRRKPTQVRDNALAWDLLFVAGMRLIALPTIMLAGCTAIGDVDTTPGDPEPPGPTDPLPDPPPSSPEELASGLAFPIELALDDSHAYVSTDVGIVRVPLEGGPAETFATGVPRGVAVDSTHLYWTDIIAGTLNRKSLAGGDAEQLASGLSLPWPVVLDEEHAYLLLGYNASSVLAVPKAGGQPRYIDMSSTAAYVPWSMAMSDDAVFWSTYDGELMRAELDGSSSVAIASGNNIFGVAVRAGIVYAFEAEDEHSAALIAVPAIGGNKKILAHTDKGALGPSAIFDGERIYWTNAVAHTGSVVSLGKDGAPRIIAAQQDMPRGIAQTDTAIYWVTVAGDEPGHGKLMKLAKTAPEN